MIWETTRVVGSVVLDLFVLFIVESNRSDVSFPASFDKTTFQVYSHDCSTEV